MSYSSASPSGLGPGQSILVVDDDRDSRTVTGAILARAGFTVVEAAGGLPALKVAAGTRVACAVLDVHLPDFSAFELCRRLLHSHRWDRTPVVFVSARTPGAELRLRMEALGFVYLERPFRAAHLLAAVGDALATGEGLGAGERRRWQVLAGAEEAVLA
ncbi:MAG TPA: response regulator [Verrucomicrobiae bacterium]|nr:response regulator [Verrucomicrobiae bacterium]